MSQRRSSPGPEHQPGNVLQCLTCRPDVWQLKSGVQQGCLLTPILFPLPVTPTAAARITGCSGSLWSQLDDLDFAYELVLLFFSMVQRHGKWQNRQERKSRPSLLAVWGASSESGGRLLRNIYRTCRQHKPEDGGGSAGGAKAKDLIENFWVRLCLICHLLWNTQDLKGPSPPWRFWMSCFWEWNPFTIIWKMYHPLITTMAATWQATKHSNRRTNFTPFPEKWTRLGGATTVTSFWGSSGIQPLSTTSCQHS